MTLELYPKRFGYFIGFVLSDPWVVSQVVGILHFPSCLVVVSLVDTSFGFIP
jgi:hypothetical protein